MEFEIRDLLSEADQEEIEKIQRGLLVSSNPNLIQCKCSAIMEVAPGRVDYNQKNDEGKPLSRQAAEHMANYRVRCNECQKNFCS